MGPIGHHVQDARLFLILQTEPPGELGGPVNERSPSIHEGVIEVEENEEVLHIPQPNVRRPLSRSVRGAAAWAELTYGRTTVGTIQPGSEVAGPTARPSATGTSDRSTATVASMTLSVSTGQAVDLRVQQVDEFLSRVERSLQVHLLPDTVVRKRRSVGARTVRDTWVRIERRSLEKITDQGWNGTESAARLEGIAQPEWHGCVVWRDTDEPAMWRADETGLLPGAPVGSAILSEAPELTDDWWEALNASLDALSAQDTRRIATPDTITITQALVTESIRGVFSGDFDTTVERWVPAHADLNWANMTAPTFSLFDWEDWGSAPLGLDSSSLWASSLAVPALADRVRRERRSDFESRDGKLMTLFACSKILGPYAHPEDPRLEPARRMAEQVIEELQAG